jgi:hypothetical protein
VFAADHTFVPLADLLRTAVASAPPSRSEDPLADGRAPQSAVVGPAVPAVEQRIASMTATPSAHEGVAAVNETVVPDASPTATPSGGASSAKRVGAGSISDGETTGGGAQTSIDCATALRDARLFRAALADAFEARLVKLVGAFAEDVLGRELRLEGIDLAAIARRIIGERRSEEPVRLRVAPADALIACDIPIVADARLQPGDAILECASGAIDARLHVRLAAVLAGLDA